MVRALPVLLGCFALIATIARADDPEPWPRDLIDPGADRTPADLLLPMPCGAEMAFQKVTVPVDAADPLADRRVRMGQSLGDTGYADYLRPAFLRGGFSDPSSGSTYYYIARYELTAGQYRALRGDCAAPSRADRLAKGGLNWFEAVDLARLYSQWLLANAGDAVPREDGTAAFLRLPTEAEWEYATRGGARVDATVFSGPTFFGDGDLRNYARFQAPGSARGRLGPVGLRDPNPLGLYDVYGNAEELMLEPFRVNAIGRAGGQVGGVVTRGGSVFSTAAEIYSAQRREYPPYDPSTGAALSADTFGLRLVLATPIATSDARVRSLQRRWQDLADGATRAADRDIAPEALLAGLIAAETDPRRRQALTGLQLELRRSRDRAQSAVQQSVSATLMAGAVFVQSINEYAGAIAAKASNIRMLVWLQRSGDRNEIFARQLRKHIDELEDLRQFQSNSLLSLRAALDTLATGAKQSDLDVAYAVLREELTLSDRGDLLGLLNRFWADLTAYRDRPDMEGADLLELALD
ncbi:formylglycine-generating enzyme family protein [Pukyongiella litopenaei]|uniref:Formylglycine-generating enzyme family protein n=1 Tax=Pukyongiella litopenaei TaxID=2605946 RepID=A0A2S0MM95_9RHOB|nr:SUMF1/EgtB/PvdO family nonheme iron enzyme [Pukyongiella litopenaei]AVO37004.1 formylglycine-generating enzyme family protein [Pukyongiella litopenaei]